MAGVPLDSTVTETIFQYNDKGQLIAAIELPDSSRQVKIYNDLDSLVGDYRINPFGDTTTLAITVYDGDKEVRRINRHLSMKIPESFENIKEEDLRNYDTMLFISEMIYDNGRHVKTLSHDKMTMITEEIEFHYENNKRTKTVTYSFIGDAKYIKETTFYDQNEDKEPDFVSIGTQGDTTAIKKTFVRSDGKVVLNYNKEFSRQDLWYYDKTGQLVAIAMVDLSARERTVSKYTYDSRGNEIEELTYRERLNNAR